MREYEPDTPKYRRTVPWWRISLYAATAVAAGLVAWKGYQLRTDRRLPPAAARVATTQPLATAASSATQPATTAPTSSVLSARQLEIVRATRDGGQYVDEAGLYVLLEAAEEIGPQGLVEMARPANLTDLLARPDRYRGHLVRMELQFGKSSRHELQNRLKWPDPVHVTTLLDRQRNSADFITIEEPQGFVPRWRQAATVAGFFYKLRTAEAEDPEAPGLTLPVIVGHRLLPARSSAATADESAWYLAPEIITPIAAGLVLALLWLVLRGHIKGLKSSNGSPLLGRGDAPEEKRRPVIAEIDQLSTDPSAPENQPIDLDAMQHGPAGAPATIPPEPPVAVSCPACGKRLTLGARFCDQCGEAIAADAVPPPQGQRMVRVALGERSYTIHIGGGLLDDLGRFVRQVAPADRAALLTDQTVGRLYAQRAFASLSAAGYQTCRIEVAPGESSKSLEVAAEVWGKLADARIERRSPLVALGGGVPGDLGGFVAATWLRGIPFVQCPTSLEAMVDASVGGKTAVNHPAGKNLIGAFYQPRTVVIDVEMLRTLDARDLRAGLAESVKHGLIRDAEFFEWHQDNVEAILGGDATAMMKLVERNCQIKAAVVSADEREGGLRAILNFGHTVGHAIESEAGYELRHGECVALGMVAACALSLGRGWLSEGQVDMIEQLLAGLGLPTRLPGAMPAERLLERTRMDKKVADAKVRYVLLRAIGQTEMVDDVSDEQVLAAIERLQP